MEVSWWLFSVWFIGNQLYCYPLCCFSPHILPLCLFCCFLRKKLLQKIGQCSIYIYIYNFCLEYLFTWISWEIICSFFLSASKLNVKISNFSVTWTWGKWTVQHHLIFWLAEVQLCWTPLCLLLYSALKKKKKVLT